MYQVFKTFKENDFCQLFFFSSFKYHEKDVLVPTVYGYPAATEEAFEAFLDVNFADGTPNAIDSADFNLFVNDTTVTIFPNSYTVDATTVDDCRIEYTQATATTGPVVVTPPVITLVTTGC